MAIASFTPQQQVLIHGEPYEILRLVSDSEWQLEQKHTGRIITKEHDELLKLFVRGELKFFIPHAPNRAVAHPESTPSIDLNDSCHFNQAKIKLAYIREIEESGIGVYTESSLSPIIDKVHAKLNATDSPPNWSTVNRWRKAYLEGSRDIRALLPRHRLKGNRERRYTDAVLKLIRKAISSLYMTRERPTIRDTRDKAIDLVRIENLQLPAEARLPMPTLALVRKEIYSIPAYERDKCRYGEQAARVKYRSVHGHNYSEKPLLSAEIDHTVLDIMVVDDESMLPLGRPTLTLCQDAMSRCILGFYIGFEPPSFLTVAQCLKHSFLPKIDINTEYPSVVNTWDCHGVMETLVVDNGMEFHSASLESLCFSFGINIQYSPRKQPWFKPFIERMIQTMNRNVAHGNPGTTFKNILDKDDYDAAKKATIRLSTLKEIIHIWIIDIYHQDIHDSLQQQPIKVWRENVDPMQTNLPADIEDLESLTGSVAVRTISHKGVELHSLLYNSKTLEELRMLLGDTIEKVDVRYNAADLGHIYVIHPVNNTHLKIPALNFSYGNGLSLWQHKVCKRFAKQHLDRTDIEGIARAKALIREIIERDYGKKKSKTRSKAARFLNNDTEQASPAKQSTTQLESDSIVGKSSTYERREMPTEFHQRQAKEHI